jgi:hypothetical protein
MLTASEHFGGFFFRQIDLLRASLLMPWVQTVFLLNFLNYCFHFFIVMCCMFSIMQSPLLFFFLCSMWKVATIWLVAKVGTPSGSSEFRPTNIVSVLSKALERILHNQVLAHIKSHRLSDFHLVSEMGIAP